MESPVVDRKLAWWRNAALACVTSGGVCFMKESSDLTEGHFEDADGK